MAEVPDIRVLVNNFRAIHNADIIINGITIVAGENGSGKSSISKLLYFLYKTVANYDDLVKKSLYRRLRELATVLQIVMFDRRLLRTSTKRIVLDELFPSREIRNEVIDLDFEEAKWISLISEIEEAFNDVSAKEDEQSKSGSNERLTRILQDILNINNIDNLTELFNKLKDHIKDRFAQAKETIELRPSSVFKSELKRVFLEGDLPEQFEVQEYGDTIISLDIDRVSIPYNIQKATYIDSPMMFHAEKSNNVHWQDLAELLDKKGDNTHKISETISNEIVKGDVVADDESNVRATLQFKRNDGEVFNLLDVATGIKSFSIIQLLLKNGFLTDKTLMIIDEPESHLHPQWIIEYARIIVMLNKEIGVKFFLATHNPDMVSALRYISEKQGTLDKVNFYLAEKSANNFQYDYKFLGKDIDPIFGSFNIAIERINKYGI